MTPTTKQMLTITIITLTLGGLAWGSLIYAAFRLASKVL